MNDQDLDRALDEALDVEPRADFLARVRADIAREPAPAAGPGWWGAAAVAAAVASLVAVGTLRQSDDRTEAEAIVLPARAAAPPQATVLPQVAADAGSARVRRVDPGKAPRHATRASARPAPGGQAASADAEMLRLAIEAAQNGLFPMAGSEQAEPGPLAMSRIDLPPLVVEPLATITLVDTGERQ